MYVKVNELPTIIISTLQNTLGYNRNDIEIQVKTDVSPFGAGSDGKREFIAIINLYNNEVEVKYGSWGGANAFTTNQVDLDTNRYSIPPNFAIIKGSIGGGHPVYAKVIIRPDMMLPCLKEGVKLSARLQWIIDTLCVYNSIGRKNEFYANCRTPPQEQEWQQLESLGLIKRNKAGSVSVTTEGKNVKKNSYPKYCAP